MRFYVLFNVFMRLLSVVCPRYLAAGAFFRSKMRLLKFGPHIYIFSFSRMPFSLMNESVFKHRSLGAGHTGKAQPPFAVQNGAVLCYHPDELGKAH